MDIVEKLRSLDFPQAPFPVLDDGTPVARAAADEIDELRDRVEELERDAGGVSDAFEGDLCVIVRQLLRECNFEFDGDPWTADTAYQHIHETLNGLEHQAEQSYKRGRNDGYVEADKDWRSSAHENTEFSA